MYRCVLLENDGLQRKIHDFSPFTLPETNSKRIPIGIPPFSGAKLLLVSGETHRVEKPTCCWMLFRRSTLYWNQEKRIVEKLEEEVCAAVDLWHSNLASIR